ncbi:MAG TPA: DUF397 domain-containing protein [Streptosporangiaceae bacterium]|nr:DUF397 domain-containing protein [Streptosporangiaceae bacterium]
MNWRKSTYSLSNGNCVEVGAGPALVAIRDSNDPDGPVISVSPGEWAVFTGYVKRVTSRHRGRDVSAPSLCVIAEAGPAGPRYLLT